MLKAGRRIATVLLLAICAVSAFAVLGDGKKKDPKNRSFLSEQNYSPGNFSLKSAYSYRGSRTIPSKSNQYINLNTVLTYQKGNTTYILPLKKKVYVTQTNNGVILNH